VLNCFCGGQIIQVVFWTFRFEPVSAGLIGIRAQAMPRDPTCNNRLNLDRPGGPGHARELFSVIDESRNFAIAHYYMYLASRSIPLWHCEPGSCHDFVTGHGFVTFRS